MYTILEERRSRRSNKRELALSYQLENVRDRGRLQALALCDENGGLFANAGDPLLCRELSALAPLLIRSIFRVPLPNSLKHVDVAVRSVKANGKMLYLISAGGGVARDALLAHSIRGVERILQSN